MASSSYTPPENAAEVFEQYRDALATARRLKPQVRKLAEEELRRGVTAGQLAHATGETDEVYRRIARSLGIDQKRPPTRTSFPSGESGGTS
ncbi:hypothetical protein [Streptomyces sp. NBRC 109706]|uniref:hypothetical protein n=1 Tax=Streptomyces sp. NBRC 109706 TaxID=1550035 RepID=UPI000781491D|nr:hypothetical protein [Streptomyces sp. NBRC 109706]